MLFMAIIVISLAWLTFQQAGLWKNCWTLWSASAGRAVNKEMVAAIRLKCLLPDVAFEGCQKDVLDYISRKKFPKGQAVPEEVLLSKMDYFRFLLSVHDFERSVDATERELLTYWMARLYRKIHHPRAEAFIAEGIRLGPDLFAEFKKICSFAFAARDWRMAKEYCTLALDVKKDDASVLAMRAAIHWENGDLSAAREDMCLAAERQPGHPVVNAIARIYFNNDLTACVR